MSQNLNDAALLDLRSADVSRTFQHVKHVFESSRRPEAPTVPFLNALQAYRKAVEDELQLRAIIAVRDLDAHAPRAGR